MKPNSNAHTHTHIISRTQLAYTPGVFVFVARNEFGRKSASGPLYAHMQWSGRMRRVDGFRSRRISSVVHSIFVELDTRRFVPTTSGETRIHRQFPFADTRESAPSIAWSQTDFTGDFIGDFHEFATPDDSSHGISSGREKSKYKTLGKCLFRCRQL